MIKIRYYQLNNLINIELKININILHKLPLKLDINYKDILIFKN